MIVKELIKQLKKFPKDAHVQFRDMEWGDTLDVNSVRIGPGTDESGDELPEGVVVLDYNWRE